MNEVKEHKPSAAWMSAEEAAAHLGVTIRVIRDSVFPNVDTLKVGRHKLINRASFHKFIQFKTKRGRQYMVGGVR